MLRRRGASDIDVPHMNSITSYKHTRVLSPGFFFLSPVYTSVRKYGCVRTRVHVRPRVRVVGSTLASVAAGSRTMQRINVVPVRASSVSAQKGSQLKIIISEFALADWNQFNFGEIISPRWQTVQRGENTHSFRDGQIWIMMRLRCKILNLSKVYLRLISACVDFSLRH